MKSYIFVFDDSQLTRRYVTSQIDKLNEVVNWLAFFDNVLCLVSDSDITELSARIRDILPGVRFIVSELDRKNGWLPKSVWRFINHPAPSDELAD